MDALTYVRSNLKKLGITDVSVKKLGRGGHGTYQVGSNTPYPKDKAEKISVGWKQKVDASGKFEGSENLSWGWGGKDDYYPLIHVWIDTDIVTKKPSKLEILSRNARPQMHTKANNTGYGRDSGPQSSDPGSYNRLTAQTYRAILKVKKAIDSENTFIGQMDKADSAKNFVKLIAMCRGLHQQLEDALTIARSSGAYRRRPGFSAAIDIWVKAGVKLQVAINDLTICGTAANSGKISSQRKLDIQEKNLTHASAMIQSIADQVQMQMYKPGHYDEEQWAPRNV